MFIFTATPNLCFFSVTFTSQVNLRVCLNATKEFGDDPLQRWNRNADKIRIIRRQIWWHDLLSFCSPSQESFDTFQAALTSSLVDGRLAHIVLRWNRLQLLTEKPDCAQQNKSKGLNTYKWETFQANSNVTFSTQQTIAFVWTYYLNFSHAYTHSQLHNHVQNREQRKYFSERHFWTVVYFGPHSAFHHLIPTRTTPITETNHHNWRNSYSVHFNTSRRNSRRLFWDIAW